MGQRTRPKKLPPKPRGRVLVPFCIKPFPFLPSWPLPENRLVDQKLCVDNSVVWRLSPTLAGLWLTGSRDLPDMEKGGMQRILLEYPLMSNQTVETSKYFSQINSTKRNGKRITFLRLESKTFPSVTPRT
jgi:hypothetical protein